MVLRCAHVGIPRTKPVYQTLLRHVVRQSWRTCSFLKRGEPVAANFFPLLLVLDASLLWGTSKTSLAPLECFHSTDMWEESDS